MRISVSSAAELLLNGHVVAVPTETVYGLAAALHHKQAVQTIFSLKGRPANNPLIIHVDDPQTILNYVEQHPECFEQLAHAFWPGPMTIVLPVIEDKIPLKVRAGLKTAAFRVPAHPIARNLLSQTGPLVMPSANLSGRPSATAPSHVETDFGADFPVLDGGICTCGLESTILIFSEGIWKIIRQGALPAEAFIPVLGYAPSVQEATSTVPLCPGQLYRHYAPQAKLNLVTQLEAHMTGYILGYRGRTYPKTLQLIELGALNSPEEVAENLYSTLRMLDEQEIKCSYVDLNIPHEGLWKTIFERLQKAAA